MRGKGNSKIFFKNASISNKDGLVVMKADSLLFDRKNNLYIFYGVNYFKFPGKIIISPEATGKKLTYCKGEDFILIE